MEKQINIQKGFKWSLIKTNTYPEKGGFSGVEVPININELESAQISAKITSSLGMFEWLPMWGAGSGDILPPNNEMIITCKFHHTLNPIVYNGEIGTPDSESFVVLAEKQIKVTRDSNDGTLTTEEVAGGSEDIQHQITLSNNNLSVEITFQYNPTAYQASVVVKSTDGSITDALEGVNLELASKVSQDEVFDNNGDFLENKIPEIQISKVSGLQGELESKLVSSDLEPLETDLEIVEGKVDGIEGDVTELQDKTQNLDQDGKLSTDGLQDAAVKPSKINLPFHIMY